MIELISYVIVGIIIGFLFTFIFMRAKNTNPSEQKMEQKLNAYQNKVEAHFAQTADLIDNLTDSYQKVFEHLSESANQLLTEEQVQRQIEQRNNRQVTLSYLNEQQPQAEAKEAADLAETDKEPTKSVTKD